MKKAGIAFIEHAEYNKFFLFGGKRVKKYIQKKKRPETHMPNINSSYRIMRFKVAFSS